jgi:hypothetical protein
MDELVVRVVKACDLRPGERLLWRGREVTVVESEHVGRSPEVNRWGRLIVKDDLSTRGLWYRSNDRLELVEAGGSQEGSRSLSEDHEDRLGLPPAPADTATG